MRIKKGLIICDAIIILLNIAVGHGNYLKNWLLFTNNSYIFPIVIVFLDIIYLFVRKGSYDIKTIRKNNYITPIYIFVSILMYCFIINFVNGGGFSLQILEPMLVAFLMLFVLNKQASYIQIRLDCLRDKIAYLSRGYVWLSLFSIIGIISSFILFKIGVVGMTPITADVFSSNENSGIIYSRVFLSVQYVYSSLLMDIRVPFFQDNGVFCGLFHEPHVLTYNVFPCLILMLGLYPKTSQKIWIIATGVLVMLFAGSATNVLVVMSCLVFYFMIAGKSSFIKSLLGVAIVLFAIFTYINIDNTFYLFIIDRLDEGNISNQSSRSLLQFAFTPKTITGSNFLTSQFVADGLKSGEDVGYISFFLNIVFILCYLRNTVKLIFKKDEVAIAVGFASLYCILHSAKIGMTVYMQILPLFLIYLQSYILTYYGRVNAIKRIRKEREYVRA